MNKRLYAQGSSKTGGQHDRNYYIYLIVLLVIWKKLKPLRKNKLLWFRTSDKYFWNRIYASLFFVNIRNLLLVLMFLFVFYCVGGIVCTTWVNLTFHLLKITSLIIDGFLDGLLYSWEVFQNKPSSVNFIR